MNGECKDTKIIETNNTVVNKAEKMSMKISDFIKIICFEQKFLVYLSAEWRNFLYYREQYYY